MEITKRLRLPIAGLLFLGTLQWMETAYAETDSTKIDSTTEASTAPAIRDVDSDLLGVELNEQTLTDARGGTEVINDMTLNGVVAGNQAYNLNTGNNTVTEGSFAGASGMPTLIQNTGNNVLIQNATIVNVQLQ